MDMSGMIMPDSQQWGAQAVLLLFSLPLGERARLCERPHPLRAAALVRDVMKAEVILVIGANPTVNHPVAATWMKNAAKNGVKLIIADPRRTELSRHAALLNETDDPQAVRAMVANYADPLVGSVGGLTELRLRVA